MIVDAEVRVQIVRKVEGSAPEMRTLATGDISALDAIILLYNAQGRLLKQLAEEKAGQSVIYTPSGSNKPPLP